MPNSCKHPLRNHIPNGESSYKIESVSMLVSETVEEGRIV